MKKDWKKPKPAPDLLYGKIPPQSLDLEEAVLGACMLERDTFTVVADIIKSEECFYNEANRQIYIAMRRMFNAGSVVDLLTITDELRKMEQLEAIGGAYYLTTLTMAVISTAHVEAHAHILMEKFMAREAIRLAGEIITLGYAPETDIFDLLGMAESGFSEISVKSMGKVALSSADQAKAAMDRIAMLQQSTDTITGITSGFRSIDVITCGWQPADLIILAARPSVGKTAVAINLAVNAAMAQYPTALFSLEMGIVSIANRILCAMGRVELWKMSSPKQLTQSDMQSLNHAAGEYSKLKLLVDEEGGLTINALKAKARRLKMKYGIRFIIIDYLQLMQGGNEKGTNREQEIAKISRDLKSLAKELDVPIIALSQLSRAVETRKESKKPQLSDLRESGAIEQDADMVMFLTRPDYQQEFPDPALADIIDVYIAKFRNGTPNVTIPLTFNKEIQLVTDKKQWGDTSYDEKLSNQKLMQQGRDNLNNEFGGSKMFVPGGFQVTNQQKPGGKPDDDVPF